MPKQRRQFTPEEKHSIIQESERLGHSETCRIYSLSSSLMDLLKKPDNKLSLWS